MFIIRFILICLSFVSLTQASELRGSGDLGVVIERTSGSVLVIEHSAGTILHRVTGLGDLSHASTVFSRDARYAYVFGRDGGLTKVDILQGKIAKRIVQAGNSIGGAISQDGNLIAVSNYEPGGVKVFASDDLSLVADIPARLGANGKRSKTVGLVDVPGNRFVYSLFDTDDIDILDMSDPTKPALQRFENVGSKPYDALVSGNGRTYIAGLFGEDGLAMLDLWQTDKGVSRILPDYGRGERRLPVYKMPHLEGWAMTDEHAFLPAVGRHEVLVVSRHDWSEAARIAVQGQPVFVMSRPDGRQVWVNFALPDNNWIQIIDTLSMEVIRKLDVGKGALHMEFTPRGEKVWISVRDRNEVQVYDTTTATLVKTLPAETPSGIFFTNRAGQIGL